MKNVSIPWRIVASFTIILVLMTGMAVTDYSRLVQIDAEMASVENSALNGLADASALSRAWSESLMLITQHIQAPDGSGAEDALRQNAKFVSQAIAHAQASATTPSAYRTVEEFRAAYADYVETQPQVIRETADPARRTQGLTLFGQRLLPAYQRGEVAIHGLLEMHRDAARVSVGRLSANVTAAVGSTKTAILVELFGALALSIGCCVGLVLSITRSLATVNNSVTEISATTREQQATANEVAATTAEIGATSREISATSKELVRTMNDVSQAAEQSAAIAGNGQTALTQMEQSMRSVIDAAGSVTTKLATLNEKAGDISQVVVTITKVADQTNLLSLNAAIEAEKAGEYGRGFAVVATEIRRLADQTAVATHDIDRMVKAMQSAVSSGVMSMDKFSEEVRRGMESIQDVSGQLSDVIHRTQSLAPRFEVVTEGMQAQVTGAEQITESLLQLSEAARQTVDSIRQSNSAIEDLRKAAQALGTGVAKLNLQPA
jgi:methyl-accepting chemotaxis protein WspA